MYSREAKAQLEDEDEGRSFKKKTFKWVIGYGSLLWQLMCVYVSTE